MRGPLSFWWNTSLLLILVVFTAKPIQAAVDFQQCCTQVPVSEELIPLQWDACHSSYNASETDPSKKWAPVIVTTYAWCHKVCEASGDFEVSGTSQWLTPLAAWFIPASALLLLLPISEHLKNDEQYFRRTKWQKLRGKYIGNWSHPLMEYIQILGDPASAFNGALAQTIADWALCLSMHRPTNGKRERELILIVMLAEQADFCCIPVRNAIELMAGSHRAREYTRTAGRVIWSARRKFNTSVVLPIALYIGVAAAVFYDAYQKLGDNDTSHSLAYGVWYNWILLLSVFANCFASHSNLDAVRSGLDVILRGVIENHTLVQFTKLGWDKEAAVSVNKAYNTATTSLRPYPAPHPPMLLSPRDLFSGNMECRGVPLHQRYQNTHNWVWWLHKNGVDVERPTRGVWGRQLLWPDFRSEHHPKNMHRYLIAQVLCWFFVLYSCTCAAIISYTTPKVGLGCRSMNHVLYASTALLNAIIRVIKDTLEESKYTRTHRVVTVIYYMIGLLNATLILIGGSFLQITGVFRNCWCSSGIVRFNANSTLTLSTNSYEHQYWARTVWLRVAYLAFGGAAVFSVLGLFVRLYITHSIRRLLLR